CRSVTYRKSSCYILLHLLGPFPPNVIVTHPLTRLYDTHGLRIYQRKPPFLVGSHIRLFFVFFVFMLERVKLLVVHFDSPHFNSLPALGTNVVSSAHCGDTLTVVTHVND